jgi:hypothetical protein
MRKLQTICVALALLTSSFPAMAWLDGNHWHRECNGSGDSGKLACLVYVHGVLAGAAGQSTLSSTKPVLCMPENGNNQQYMDVYSQYLQNNPQDRHMDATALMFIAFIKAFPCK